MSTTSQRWLPEHTALQRRVLDAMSPLTAQIFDFDEAAELAWPAKVRAATETLLVAMRELETACPPLDEQGRTRRLPAQATLDQAQELITYAMAQLRPARR